MSGKKIVGIILVIVGLIGAYYYIGGYLQCKNSSAIGFYDQAMSGFASMFGMSGVCDTILQQYWPMMAASIAVLILGVFLIFKGDDEAIESTTNSTPIQPSSITTLNFEGDKSLTNDAYKIFLVKKYGIEKNEALGKIICQGKLFDDTEKALQHAAELDNPNIGFADKRPTNAEFVYLTEVPKTLAKDKKNDKQFALLTEEARTLGITYDDDKFQYKGSMYENLDDALSYARKDSRTSKARAQSEREIREKENLKNSRLLMVLAVIFSLILIAYFANTNSKRVDTVQYLKKINYSPREMLQICGGVFFFASDIEENINWRRAMQNNAYKFINVARYGYDKPYYNQNAESDSNIIANKIGEASQQKDLSFDEFWDMELACINAGKPYGIKITNIKK